MTDPLFAQPAGGIARVALPVPIDSLFDYAIPAALASALAPGKRVLVPFSGRKLTGVVVSLETGSGGAEHNADPSHTKGVPRSAGDELLSIEQVLDGEAVISPGLMKILVEAARVALCPVGIALQTALPSGSAPRVTSEFELLPRGRAALQSRALRGDGQKLLEALADGPLPTTRLARCVPRPEATLEALARDGLVRRRQGLRGPSARVARKRFASVASGADWQAALQGELLRAPSQAALLREIAAEGPVETQALLARTKRGSATLRELVGRGLVTVEEREVPRNVLGAPVARDAALVLSPEQEAALAPITRCIREGRFSRYLLHGVTGSGKTEVYLRAIAEALDAGRQALVLVPEITLTHQIVARLRARFGDGMAVLHSGLRASERLEQWQRLRQGATPIAVGARSALFAPLENLGVIVIDEEHDSAYKNAEGFRYHAGDLAERRAAEAGCPLVLGSATPSLETRYRADGGDIVRLVLQRRIGGRPLPAVELVDLAEEKRKLPRGRRLVLSRALRRAIAQTLAEGGQSILFLNRRGFSTQIFCFDCGFAERCADCDVALVYHAAESRLRCHYCDYDKPPPERCGGCGQPDTALLGTGTERLEEEVRALFPEARLARLDRDSAQRRGHVEQVLSGLHESEVDILIGTQMVAKGHDFPGVRLVGVVAADLGLHMPDFRAAERTFQLLTQVAGRAGRSTTPGRVIVQSFVPDHYAIAPVVEHDYERFYREELAHRRALLYPPFSQLVQLMVSGEDEEAVRKAAEQLAAAAGAVLAGSGCEVLGPAPAPLPRLRGRHRHQLLLKGDSATDMRRAAEHLAAAANKLPRGLHASLDVAPVNML